MRRGSHHTAAARAKLAAVPKKKCDALARFNGKVDFNGPTIRPELGPCHIWQGKRRRAKFNYGQFYFNGRFRDAHRWIFERVNGELPPGQCALHRCDNPQCVNIEHLFAGTRRENVADMDAKGRRVPARGERQHGAKLTARDAESIRWLYFILRMPIKKIARVYAIGETTVANIVHRRTWAHVPDTWTVQEIEIAADRAA